MKTPKQFLIVFFLAVFLLGNAGHYLLPHVFTNVFRSYNSQIKSNLHNIFLACKVYWADKGSTHSCNADIAKGNEYGYIQSPDVVIHGSGPENDFCAIAWPSLVDLDDPVDRVSRHNARQCRSGDEENLPHLVANATTLHICVHRIALQW